MEMRETKTTMKMRPMTPRRMTVTMVTETLPTISKENECLVS
jgi:hypothetical protein